MLFGQSSAGLTSPHGTLTRRGPPDSRAAATTLEPPRFAERPVEREKLLSLLEAARWAPLSNNEQPWHYFIATKDEPEEFATLLGCLVEKNQSWAKAAPVLMLSVASTVFGATESPTATLCTTPGRPSPTSRCRRRRWACSSTRWPGSASTSARETYGIPDNAEPVAALAIGYLGDPNSLPPDLRERELVLRGGNPFMSSSSAARGDAVHNGRDNSSGDRSRVVRWEFPLPSLSRNPQPVLINVHLPAAEELGAVGQVLHVSLERLFPGHCDGAVVVLAQVFGPAVQRPRVVRRRLSRCTSSNPPARAISNTRGLGRRHVAAGEDLVRHEVNEPQERKRLARLAERDRVQQHPPVVGQHCPKCA